MPTAYTTILKLALPVTGELDGTWGDVVNDNITEMIEEAIAGKASVSSWTGASATLTTANGTTSQSRCAILDCSGAPGANATVICPTATKVYVVNNQVTGGYTVTLKTSGGTGIAVPNGSCMLLYCDGTNVVAGVSYVATAGAANSVNGSAVTGTVAVANGGTGANTLTGILKGNGTSAVSAAVSGTDIKTVNGNSLLGSGNLSVTGSLVRSARTSNTILAAADQSTLVDVTTGGFTQTFTAAATLGSGWWCVYRNNSTTDVTLDPNSSETIDGLTSYVMYPGEARIFQCDGSNFYTVLLTGFSKTFTSSGTFTKPPGYVNFGVFAQGPGGGGGSGSYWNAGGYNTGGGGGGGGAFVLDTVRGADVGTTESVTVGTGGAGGAALTSQNTSGNAGSAGSGASSFGVLVSATAGSGGGAGSYGSSSIGGSGATAAGALVGAGTAGGQGLSAELPGTPGTASTTTQAATGGGGGGTLYHDGSAHPTAGGAGGASGTFSSASQLSGGAGGGTSSAGSTGNSTNRYRGGTGGGGGGAANSAAAGAGGAGVRGGGGGGGGGSYGFNSGAGGAGGDGVVVVWGIV